MKEIQQKLVRIVQFNEVFQKSPAPEQLKIKVMEMVNSLLDFVIEETSSANINKLVVDEMRIKLREKIKNDV